MNYSGQAIAGQTSNRQAPDGKRENQVAEQFGVIERNIEGLRETVGALILLREQFGVIERHIEGLREMVGALILLRETGRVSAGRHLTQGEPKIMNYSGQAIAGQTSNRQAPDGKRENQVAEQFGVIERNIEGLRETVGALILRAGPVMREAPPPEPSTDK